MGKQATTKEVQDAMNDPKDIKEATCLQFFMVILRAILYFMAFIGSMMAVVAYEVWRGKIKSKRQGFEGKVNPFNWFLWLLECSEACVSQSTTDINLGNTVVVSAGAAFGWGFLMFVITILLLCNKKVKVKQSIIIESVIAGVLMMMTFISACIVTVENAKTCSTLSSKASSGCQKLSCQDLYHVCYNGPQQLYGDGSGYYRAMIIIQDGLWTSCLSYFVLSIMLYIRFRNARSQKKNYSTFDQQQQAGTTSKELDNPAGGESSTDPDGEGNPFD
eukprot:m.891760 g.891760  ORF g.891760 m.891760 type:complete len:275 (+) comp23653_c0_seq32:300-1124(+)